MTWAISMVQKLREFARPKSRPTNTNISIREMPVMISGFVMGMSVATFSVARSHLERSFMMPTEAAVPMTVEIAIADTARSRVLRTLCRVASSRSSSRYHFKEKPENTLRLLASLKENTKRMAMGANRKMKMIAV